MTAIHRIVYLTLLTVTLLTSFVVGAQPVRSNTIRVTLLQVNDVYQISPVDKGKNGGLARLATLRKNIQAESPNTLFLLAGDTLSPSVASNIFKGEQMIAGWNAAGLDYAVLGNHEFDFGDEILLARMKASKFPWLAANVINRKNGKPFGGMQPYFIRSFAGVKVGIFGILTPETAKNSSPGKDVRFLDPNKTTVRIVQQLRARGATVIIAITHLTMPEDKRLARAAKIDVIIGGHEHSVLQSQSGCTPIFKMGSDARLLGRIDLNISKITRRVESIDYSPIPVTDAVPDEQATAAIIGEYEKKLSVELDKPVGNTTVELDARQITGRSHETNLGSFITDAFRQATNADVALMNGGSIRSNTTYGPGALTKRDVLSILPFENTVVKAEVTGAQLRAALEHSVAKIVEESESGRFLQVSGLQFSYDGRKPPGSRVVQVTINGQALDLRKNYTLASGTYLLEGGDGYAMFKGVKYLISAEDAKVDAVILAAAITTAGTIAPNVDGRIKRIDQ